MTYGLLSDLHYSSKPYRLRSALRALYQANIIMIVGDIADRGTQQQFSDVRKILSEEAPHAAIFSVCGNHDLREGNQIYKVFENDLLESLSSQYIVERSQTGAYYVQINTDTDLIGLNPLYHQKIFHFPAGGEQLAFLEAKLSAGNIARHIVLCHPPLIAHNPQRSTEMPPYLPKEQDQRLQSIVNKYGHMLFISGHTHFAPTIERDELRDVTYINDGSINPTVAGNHGETRRGNVFQIAADGAIHCISL